jgi:hypothetical protein
VSSIPAEIPGVGASTLKLRVNPAFNPVSAAIGPQEYFVLSRIDGIQTLREILVATGLAADRAVQIAQTLRSVGAVLLPGETTPQSALGGPAVATLIPKGIPPAPTRTITLDTPTRRPEPATFDPPTTRRSTPSPSVSLDAATERQRSRLDLSLPAMTGTESSALQEAIEMSDSDRRRILALARLVPNNNPWVLLGVEQSGPLQDVKRAYFRLSKEVHPDRYYGKRLGSFAVKLNEVFEAVTRAYTELSSKSKKTSNAGTTATDTPQTPQEYALELFERACASEVSGDSEAAMKLFAAVVRMQPQLRYLRRAASCALTAAQPRTALEYAKKASALAPDDASLARLLAQSFRAAGQLEQAEEVLVMAMAIKSENDVLTMELRNELAAVRRAIGR